MSQREGHPVFRDARPEDAEPLVDVFRAVLEDGRGMALPAADAFSVEKMRSHLARRAVALVVELDGALVGQGTLTAFGPAYVRHSMALAMHLHPRAQGRGVGRALLQALLARATNLERVELYVRADNDRAIALYRSSGFVLEGVRTALLRTPQGHVSDMIMTRHQRAPIAEKAVPVVLRPGRYGPDVLVFEHPYAGIQLAKGSVEPGEAPRDAAQRELEEESGLTADAHGDWTPLGSWIQPWPTVRTEVDAPLHRVHAFVAHARGTLPDHWVWQATGSPMEHGLTFHFRWQPLEVASVLPAFQETLERVRAWADSSRHRDA